MTFAKLTLFMVTCGLIFISLKADQAPAILTMNILYESENDNMKISMDTLILPYLSTNVIYKRLGIFEKIPLQRRKYELNITFPLEDIKQSLTFNGVMKILQQYNRYQIYDFQNNFSFENSSLKSINGVWIISKTFYSLDLTTSLDVTITAKCLKNFYPENVCIKFCHTNTDIEFCDKNGNKICRKGYKLNINNQKCHYDWCFNPESKCLNGGLCINMENRFRCQCTISYTGTYCEEYQDLCINFICPNRTLCIVEKEKILCKWKLINKTTASSAKSELLNISSMTMIAIVTSIIITSIGFCVTIWACKKPKRLDYKYTEENSSIKTPSYYNNGNHHTNSLSGACHTSGQIPCACKWHQRNPEYNPDQIENYYSIQRNNGRNGCHLNRANSDIVISRSFERNSLMGSLQTVISNPKFNGDTLPLPPPMESDNLINHTLYL